MSFSYCHDLDINLWNCTPGRCNAHTHTHTHTHAVHQSTLASCPYYSRNLVYQRIHIHTYSNTYTYMYTHIYTHTPAHTHTHMCTHIHTYTHTHTHTHTQGKHISPNHLSSTSRCAFVVTLKKCSQQAPVGGIHLTLEFTEFVYCP